MAATVFLESRETEGPRMKRGKLCDNAVYLVINLSGALGESWNVFPSDVILDPISRLPPMPSVANMLNSLLNGLFNTHGLQERSSLADTVADLGTRWEVERVSIKPYPCCHFAHGAVDCALALRAEAITADEVQGTHAIVDTVAAGFICHPIESKYSPNNAYGAKFSLPYLVACALIDGRLDQGSFTDAGIYRQEILTFARKLTYEEAKQETTGFPNYFPGHLRVTLSDGRVMEKRVAIT